jgi:hypothetical protein
MKKYILLLLVALFLFGCSASKPSLEKAIIGTWVDASGYEIQFFSGGKGFIPGVPDKIPDSDFIYSIVDENHITLDIQETKQTLEIRIEGDTLTWKDDLGEVIYKRTKK